MKRFRIHQAMSGHSELNLVPYLDVIINLVMFMLLSMSGFVAYQTTNATFADGSPLNEAALPGQPPPTLEVRLTSTGFDLGLDGRALPPIGLDASHHHDFAALAAEAARVKAAFPLASNVKLGAERAVSYDLIVQTMDAVRGSVTSPLFPSVAIGTPIAFEGRPALR